MAGTGIHGWTGTTSNGSNVVNGIVQTPFEGGQSGSTVRDGSLSGSSGSSSGYSAIASLGNNIGTLLQNGVGDAYRELMQIAHGNSALSQQYAREQMDYQTSSNQYAMDWSAAQAKENRDWQEMMSNTAHQREVKDLVEAGLNPILSANNGASSPAGAVGNGFSSSGAMGTVDNTSPLALLNTLIQSATQLKSLDISADLQREQMQNSLKVTQLGGMFSESVAGISAAANIASAQTAAEAAKYGYDLNSDYNHWKTIVENGTNRYKIDVDKAIRDRANDITESGQGSSGIFGNAVWAGNKLGNELAALGMAIYDKAMQPSYKGASSSKKF